MKVALVSMPWSSHDRPSAALGAIAAYVRRERPAVEVVVHSEHVLAAAAVGYPLYELVAHHAYRLGETLYMEALYPGQAIQVRSYFLSEVASRFTGSELSRTGLSSWEAAYEHLLAARDAHLTEASARLAAGGYDLIALTTCFGQLFANLALCERLKARRAEVRTVLGGSTVSSRCGPSLLAEYSSIDFVVQGEGERPFVALLDELSRSGDPAPIPGVLHRHAGAPRPEPAPLVEVPSLEELPLPDYDEYASLVSDYGLDWVIPVEGSRGCWWDRAKKTGNPRNTCYFCNLNVQWTGYREKTAARVAGEMKTLSERYENTRVFFLDNILRHGGAVDLGEAIRALGKHFDIFYEMRASIRPAEMLAMWEAGVTSVQLGIEGLSSAYLSRIGKGTTVIQNLQAMKLCAELGIGNAANLIVRFPGSTPGEVEESCHNVLHYALPFEPCSLLPFRLSVDATLDTLREEFGIRNVRNCDAFRAGLPEDVWKRLELFDLDFDVEGPQADWSPLYRAVERWRARQAEVDGPLLTYQDGGTFLTVVDRRTDWDIIRLREPLRSIYLFCQQIRTREEILRRFAEEADHETVLQWLAGLVEDDLLFEEKGKYLALAMASRPRLAAARIRSETARSEAGRPPDPA